MKQGGLFEITKRRKNSFLSSIAARPPSTFFSWARTVAVAAISAVMDRNLRLEVPAAGEAWPDAVASWFTVPDNVSFREPAEKVMAPCVHVPMQSKQSTQRL